MAMPRTDPRILVALAITLGGCVVPIGPEWTDPQKEYPPTVVSANPPIGSVLTPDASTPLAFEVVVSDQNTNDRLAIRWLIDYPPYEDGVSTVAMDYTLPASTDARRPTLRFAPNCHDDRIASGITNHRLLLLVCDRPFAVSAGMGTNLDVASADGKIVHAAWQFVLLCP